MELLSNKLYNKLQIAINYIILSGQIEEIKMRVIIISIICLFFITGCSVFQPTQKLDMNPFAENSATLFGEAVKISRTFQWKHCKPYTSIPEFQSMFQRAIPILGVLRGVVYYSNQVVAINN